MSMHDIYNCPPPDVAKVLVAIRKARGDTPAQFAHRIGVTVEDVGWTESGVLRSGHDRLYVRLVLERLGSVIFPDERRVLEARVRALRPRL